MPIIVISYRRSQTEAIAGRIRDRLAEEYGDDSVYIDIDSIPIGTDFRDHIDKALSEADVMVAVIGPKWLGQRRARPARIRDERDPVRIEIETALRNEIPIMPVLVNGADMPASTELPESIQKLADLNAIQIDAGRDFGVHVRRLIEAVDQIVPRKSLQKLIRSPRRLRWGTVAAACALVIIAAWWLNSGSESVPPVAQQKTPIAQGAKAKSNVPPPQGGEFVPPSPRSYWDYEKSLVYLEASGDSRKFIFIEPDQDFHEQGAERGTLLFDGWRSGDTYIGKAYIFAGNCGAFPYNVRGSVLSSDTVVEVAGKAPIIDAKTCQQTGARDEKLVFKYKYRL